MSTDISNRYTDEQTKTFSPVTGRYIRFVALSEVNGNAWASVAEINLLGSEVTSIKTSEVKQLPESFILHPVYLDVNDGLVNLSYYDAMAGCHLGIFPSYYEPWGYTPL